MVANYLAEQELRDYLQDPSTTAESSQITDAIASASRLVDAYCGRFFYQETAPRTQYVSPNPNNLWILGIDDLSTLTGLDVTAQWANTSNYNETWNIGTDFIAEPINQQQDGIQGWPYTFLRALGPKVWPFQYLDFYRDTVKITGTWGWLAVPAPVKQATKILAAQYYKLGGAPFGVAGFGTFGDIRVKDIPQVMTLLKDYKRGTTLLMA